MMINLNSDKSDIPHLIRGGEEEDSSVPFIIGLLMIILLPIGMLILYSIRLIF